MADTEIKTVLTVDTGDSYRSIGQLREEISSLRKSLNDVNATEEQNRQTVDQLRASQAELRDAMYATSKSTEQLIADSQAQDKSYNQLVKTLSDLKSRWRETTNETERANLGDRINVVNGRLKELDASTGNFQRNVGDYTGSIINAFSMSSKGAASMVAPLKNVNGVMKLLSTNPMIAIFGLLVPIIQAIIKALKSSEENMKSLSGAMGLLGSVGDLITKMLQGLGKILGNIADAFVRLADKLNLVNEAARERMALTRAQIELDEYSRDLIVKNADTELRIAQLRQQAADKINNTATERIALLEEVARLSLEVSQSNVEQAKREYDIIKRRNALTQSSTEEKRAEAEAYAKMVKAETDYFNKTKEITAQISEARNKEIADAKAAANERVKIREEEIKRLEALAKAEQDQRMKNLELQIALVEQGSTEEMNLQLHKMQRLHDLEVNQAKLTIQNRELLNETLLLLEQNLQQDILTYQVEFAEKAFEAEEKAYNERVALQRERAEEAYNEEMLRRENDVASLEEGSMQRLEAELMLRKIELDTLHQLEDESNEQFRARQIAADKAYADARASIYQSQLQMMQTYAGALSGLMGSIADAIESGSENDKKSAQRAKNIRIASTTIDTISGAAGAYMQAAKSLPPPLGIILGAANAATVLASGIAQVNKIKSTQINDSAGSGSSSNVASMGNAAPALIIPPTIEQDVPTTTVVRGATEEQQLNRIADRRVYILSSDLEANSKRVDVVKSETTF